MTTVPAKARFTPDDLIRLEHDGNFELIDGKLVEKNMSLLSNLTAGRVMVALTNFATPRSLGVAMMEQSFQCFPHDRHLIRRPDVSFILADRMPSDLSQGHASVAPDIAVEVVSPTDLIYDLDEKLSDYRSAGVRLVWIINPNSRTVVIHRLDRSLSQLDETGVLQGETVLPDFQVPVAQLLPPATPPATPIS